MQSSSVDLIIIGGGINGAGIAYDAAQRGLKVILLEQDDLASCTSSKSSKLIHGGLRYLENYDFRMVAKSIKERDLLLRLCPHLIQPQEFIIPLDPKIRPSWLVKLGLFIYNLLSIGSKFPREQKHDLAKRAPLKQSNFDMLSYYDAKTNDARLVVNIAKQAKWHGAKIFTYHQVTDAVRSDYHWQIQVYDKINKQNHTLTAKSLVNATGPYTKITTDLCNINSKYSLTWVKGSHIVISNKNNIVTSYLLQCQDKRIIFVIPYINNTLMIGTTDVKVDTIAKIDIDDDEIHYLIANYNHYFAEQITRDNIVDAWSGVRPLISQPGKKAAEISRDFELEIQASVDGKLPIINIWGGKLTTFRVLSAQAVDMLRPFFDFLPNSSTKNEVFADSINFTCSEDLKNKILKDYSFLSSTLIERLTKTYGMAIYDILKNVTTVEDLGQHIAHNLYAVEVDYLREHEFATTADDILQRRTDLDMLFSVDNKETLENYLILNKNL